MYVVADPESRINRLIDFGAKGDGFVNLYNLIASVTAKVSVSKKVIESYNLQKILNNTACGNFLINMRNGYM